MLKAPLIGSTFNVYIDPSILIKAVTFAILSNPVTFLWYSRSTVASIHTARKAERGKQNKGKHQYPT